MSRLKAVLDTLDGLDEARTGLYVQGDDGRYYLDAEGVDDLPAVQGLRGKRDELLKAQRELRDQLKAFEGLDAEAARTALAKLEELEDGKLKDKGEFDKLRERIEKKHADDLAKVQAEIARRDGFIERLLIENAITAAIEEAKVLPQYREAVKALMYQRGPKVVADGDDYRAYFETDMGEAAVGAYVEAWARSDEAAAFLPPSGKSGGGASPTGGGGLPGGAKNNPWRKDSFNITEQGRITRENPELAAQLKAAAA